MPLPTNTGERLVDISTLTGVNSAIQHYMNIDTGVIVAHVFSSYKVKYLGPISRDIRYVKPSVVNIAYLGPAVMAMKYVKAKTMNVEYQPSPKIKIKYICNL